MELKLARCTLRPWRRGDEASLVLHANNRSVWLNLRDRFPHPYTAKDADEWIARAGAQAPVLNFAIVVDGAAVGGTGRARDRRLPPLAAVGYWLGQPFWGRGIATEALRAVTDYAFTTLASARLEAGVLRPNPRRRACWRRPATCWRVAPGWPSPRPGAPATACCTPSCGRSPAARRPLAVPELSRKSPPPLIGARPRFLGARLERVRAGSRRSCSARWTHR